MSSEDDAWRLRARCRNIPDPDLFFVSDEEHRPKRKKTQELTKDEETAVAVCSRCPVSGNCLETALADHRLSGVWGGTTSDQRRALRRGRFRSGCPRCMKGRTMRLDKTTQVCMSCGLSWFTE
jgi:WhiB family redox-sensing transcriptional regulator